VSIEIKTVRSNEGKRLIEAINGLKNKGVKVGWITGSHYTASKIPVAAVAFQNEFGNSKRNIPARPFMRPTIMHEENNWRKIATDGARKIIKNQTTTDQVLDSIGHQAEGDIKKTISNVYYPALAESTVLNRIRRNAQLSSRKGRLTERQIGNITKPLIDTGIMFNTITHELTDE
jgi:hypothetical protein